MIYPNTYQISDIQINFHFPEGVQFLPIPLANCGAFHDLHLSDVERTAEELEFIRLCKSPEPSFKWKDYECQKIYSDWACTIFRSNCPYKEWLNTTMMNFIIEDMDPRIMSRWSSFGYYGATASPVSYNWDDTGRYRVPLKEHLNNIWENTEYVYAYTHGVSFKEIIDGGFCNPLYENYNERIFNDIHVVHHIPINSANSVVISSTLNYLITIYPFKYIVNMDTLGNASETNISIHTVSPGNDGLECSLDVKLKTVYNSDGISIIYGYYEGSLRYKKLIPTSLGPLVRGLSTVSPIALLVDYSKLKED